MKVSLLYNDRAGSGASLERIRGALTAHGHDLVRVITDRTDLQRLIEPPVDLVISAGGDGTAANAARTVAGRAIPLAILPLGTANNIAKSVGYIGSIEDLIGGLRYDRRRLLDLGTATGPWGVRTFVESVGGGIIAAGIEAMKARRVGQPVEPPAARMERALRGLLRDHLATGTTPVHTAPRRHDAGGRVPPRRGAQYPVDRTELQPLS